MIIAGIVVYKPDYKRLEQNITVILKQVDCLIIYKNSDIEEKTFLNDDKIVFIGSGINVGIAKALNEIMRYAYEHGVEWCLLLDQDSIVMNNYIDICEKNIMNSNAAILSPIVIDDSDIDFFYKNKKASTNHNPEIIDMCITSGSYNNVLVWRKVGGFLEEFFIDYVDWEYCACVRKEGYNVYKIPCLHLNHELGLRSYHNLLGIRFFTFNHNAFRKYFITRNTIVAKKLYPSEHCFKYPYLKIIKRLFITVLYESDKMHKINSILKGIIASKKLYKQVKDKR